MAEHGWKSIEQEWQGFAASVLPKNAPQVQRDEMRMAFFAGAWVLVTQTERMGESDIPEDEALRQIISLRDECKEFKKEYMQRYTEKN